MKMSSINSFQICMFLIFCFTSSVSSVPINRFAYEGAILVPMAVPCFCIIIVFVVEFKDIVF